MKRKQQCSEGGLLEGVMQASVLLARPLGVTRLRLICSTHKHTLAGPCRRAFVHRPPCFTSPLLCFILISSRPIVSQQAQAAWRTSCLPILFFQASLLSGRSLARPLRFRRGIDCWDALDASFPSCRVAKSKSACSAKKQFCFSPASVRKATRQANECHCPA